VLSLHNLDAAPVVRCHIRAPPGVSTVTPGNEGT
jgi:hypothetical protein